MVVKIEEIKESGLELSEQVATGTLDELLTEDGGGFKARGALPYTVRLTRVSGGVLLHGGFKAELTAPCKRCLTDVRLSLPGAFTLNLVPHRPAAASAEADDDGRTERAGSFELTDADQEPFDGRTIDLDPILREQVLLALPVSVVCREDCKGLCSVCGQNLNERECGCERKVLDPRLAALKDIKLN